MKIRYSGPSDERIIRREDWEGIDPGFGGPIDHETVVWDMSNDFTQNISDPAGEFLIKYDREFSLVELKKK